MASGKKPRVVVRRVDNLGDIVIALPVLEALRRHHADANLTLMVHERHQPLCRHLADEFIAPATLEQFPRIAKRYDHGYNIDYFPIATETPAPNRSLGTATKANAKVSKRPSVLHINGVSGRKIKHIGSHLADGLEVHGIPAPRHPIPKLPVDRQLRERVKELLKKDGLQKDGLWLGIHVGSRETQKCWPADKYSILAKWLYRSFGAHLFFFGTHSELGAIETATSVLPEQVWTSVVGMDLDLVAGLLSKMDFVIGNDSGISHLAAAVSTPTIFNFRPDFSGTLEASREKVDPGFTASCEAQEKWNHSKSTSVDRAC